MSTDWESSQTHVLFSGTSLNSCLENRVHFNALKGIQPPSDERMLEFTEIANGVLNKHGKYSFFMKDNKKEGIKC